MIDYQYFTQVIKSFFGRKEGGMMRRRMMMGGETPIQYLKSIGCKLWLPLNSKHGLEAVIGNTRIVNVVSNAVTINTSVDMGEIRFGAVDVPVATLTTDWTSADFPNDEWTTFAQGKKYTSSSYGTGNVMKFPTIGNNYRDVVYCVDVNNTSNSRYWNDKKQNSFQMFKNIEQSVNRKWYWSDGIIKPVLKLEDTLTENVPPFPYSERVINVAAYAQWTANLRIFLKNVMIFNRHLTEDEMQKILTIL